MSAMKPVVSSQPLAPGSSTAPIGPEPEHGCCTRVLCVPAAALACFPASAFLAAEAVSAPLQFIALVICKVAICNCCCPENIHHTFQNIICTPCRWGRIACTGKGHIMCCEHPAWPFRP